MLPMGGAKGAALVLMVEILAAGLSGANFGLEASSFLTADGTPPGVGQMILAFDPGSLCGGSYLMRLEDLISEITQQENARLPGSQRFLIRKKAELEGLLVPNKLMDELYELSNR